MPPALIALTEYLPDTYNIDSDQVYANGYSGGGETMSLALGIRPALFTAYLHCSSQWDGAYEPVAEAQVPVYLVIGEGDLLRGLAAQRNATPAQISLAWMLCKKPWIVPIPGSRKTERMRENAGAADVALTPSEAAQIDHILETVPMSAVFGGTAIKSR